MTLSPWMLYWIMRLDDFCTFLTMTFVLSALVTIVLFFRAIGFPDEPEWFPDKSRVFFKFLALTMGLMLFGSFLPSSKEMAAILVVPKIVNNQKVQAIPSKILDLANAWLDALKPKEAK